MHDVTERPRSDAVRRDRRNDRGVLLTALLVSALVHAVIFFGMSFEIQLEPRVTAAPPVPLIHVTPAMQAFDLVQVTGDVAPIEVQIREREALRPLPAIPGPPARADDVPGERAAAEPVDPISVRDRLRYRLNTPQVWRRPTEEVVLEPTPEEIVQRRIAAQLGEYNDSVAAEAAMRERASDWTVKDGDGGRWGVSPGAIHLGSITIPVFDSHFAAAPGRREEFAGRIRNWNELQDQAVRVEARETFKDRVRAIEERKAKERAERGHADSATTAAGTPPGPPAKPNGGGNSR